eukprot:5381909-Ditylum_brightwellii.AAC.1
MDVSFPDSILHNDIVSAQDDFEESEQVSEEQPVHQSQHQQTPTVRWLENEQQKNLNLNVAYSTYYDVLYEDEDVQQDEMQQPLAFLSQADLDTMQYHQAVQKPECKQFIKAIVCEVNMHTKQKHWTLIPKNLIPEGFKVLSAVWAMKRKRDIKRGRFYKWKAHLNVHGGQQVKGVNYWETYALKIRQVDFIFAYLQAPIECPLYMALPAGIVTKEGNSKTHVLKLEYNLYRQKRAGQVWNMYLTNKMKKVGFTQSKVDKCANNDKIDEAIRDIKKVQLDIDDQGKLEDYLGINMSCKGNKIKLTQPHTIE